MVYKDRLIYLQLPSLSYRRLRGSMIETYKIVSGLYSADVTPVLRRNYDTRTRGNSCKLLVKRCRLDVRKFSFCNRVVHFWNMLPNSVVNSVSVNSFKNSLDKFCKQEGLFYEVELHDLEFRTHYDFEQLYVWYKCANTSFLARMWT